ncbi:alpha/beta hydrolase-fold protein [Acaricomes phytoseiuli]|nr:alpha/beta hydrolase-fold protein [Acaricomes phytoseiuli]MCW1250271.1 alpha/beta hydrolase-fold protein [Acaricomes phytoseiuli]
MTVMQASWSSPRSAGTTAAPPLLVLLHGYGADENDLMDLAGELPPEFAVASVRASHRAGPGFAWFPLAVTQDGSGGMNLGFEPAEVQAATADLSAWLDTVQQSYSSVTLLGFSQGMTVASSLARHRPDDFSAVVGLSGFVLDTKGEQELFRDFFHDAELAARKMPFFWGRDQADPVIPQPAVEFSNEWLNGHTVLTKVLYADMWHGICAAEVKHVSEFLRATVLSA